MAENITCTFTSVDAQAIITMDQTINQADTGLGSANSTTSSDETLTFTSADAQVIFAIDDEIDQTDTGIGSDYNTDFAGVITHDEELGFETKKRIRIITIRTPINFYSRIS